MQGDIRIQRKRSDKAIWEHMGDKGLTRVPNGETKRINRNGLVMPGVEPKGALYKCVLKYH